MIRRPPRSTPLYSSAASDVYKRQRSGPSRLRQRKVQPGRACIPDDLQLGNAVRRPAHSFDDARPDVTITGLTIGYRANSQVRNPFYDQGVEHQADSDGGVTLSS